jgi:putative MFS transporter
MTSQDHENAAKLIEDIDDEENDLTEERRLLLKDRTLRRGSLLDCFAPKIQKQHRNEVDEFLERVGYTKFHFNMIFINSIIFFIVGCEFVIINIMLTTLEKEWNLSKNQVSFLGSAIFIGVFFPSLIAGYVNNRFGRKLPSIIGCIIISISSILTCFTNSFFKMFIIKVIIGIGIGIMIPGLTSLMTECIPKHNRSLILNLVWGLYPIGIIYCCFISINYVNRNILDWRSTSLINSFSTIPVVFVALYLKESPRYLILKDRFEEAFHILNLIGKSKNIQLTSIEKQNIRGEAAMVTEADKTFNLNGFFKGQFLIITIFLIFLWYSSSLVSYGLLNVLPKHFESLTKKDKADGFKNMMAAMIILSFCPFFRGWISELKFLGRKNTLAIGFLGAFVCSMMCVADDLNLSLFSGTLNFFINISLGIVSVYTSEVYPTSLRSGALGFGNAFTRLGGITAPFICQLCDSAMPKGSFYLFCFCSLISAVFCCLLPIETLGMALDSHYIKQEESKK